MGEIDSEQFHNDFEIEISNVDESEIAASSSQPSLPFQKPCFSLRQRRLYLILLNALMILLMVFLLTNTTPVRKLVSSVFLHPTSSPTATLIPGVDLFYVRTSPTWGQLFLDGHPTPPPTINIAPPLRFARGLHQLIWRANPFLEQRCTVSVPPNFADTCRDHETTQASSGLSAWVITFSESLATLSGSEQADLLEAAQTALDAMQSTDMVQTGERYTLAPFDSACQNAFAHEGYQCYATANQPLKATLSFRLDTNQASNETCIDPEPSCTHSHHDCRLFCGGTFPAPSSKREWEVFAPVLSLWTFATRDGRVLAHNVPDDSAQDYATGQALDESLVQLRITWDSLGWHVPLSANLDSQGSGYQGSGYYNPVCAAMTQQMVSLNPPASANGDPLYLQWQYASSSQAAAGCLAMGTPQRGDSVRTPIPTHVPQPVFYYLHRFGVFLAVNKLAQSSGPLLPLADAYEQQLTRELIGETFDQSFGYIS